MNKSVNFIIPALNEEHTIKSLLLSIHNFYPNAKIILIDNMSTDKTYSIAKSTIEINKLNAILLVEKIKGKGNAVRKGMRYVDPGYCVFIDADLTYPIDKFRDMFELMNENDFDMVVGDRIKGGGYIDTNSGYLHFFGNHLITKTVNFLFNTNLNDCLSGFRILSYEMALFFPFTSKGFEIEVDLTLFALINDFRIGELPINYFKRHELSYSKLSTFRDGILIIIVIFKIFTYYRPLYFFGYLGSFFSLMGILMGTTVITQWLETGFITRIPLSVLSSSLEIIGLLFFVLGFILNFILIHYKNNLSILRNLFFRKNIK